MLTISRLVKGPIDAPWTQREVDADSTENLTGDETTNYKAPRDVVTIVQEVLQIDLAMMHIHEKFEDDADERADYQDLGKRRLDRLEFLAETPSQSRRDMVAKARLLLSGPLISDYEMHCAVANSLARDVLDPE